jgi:upstream activation factor subunit UAF30
MLLVACRGPKRKRNTGGGMGSLLSEEMQQFLGVERMARTQVVKAIWAYIKENNLQVRRR